MDQEKISIDIIKNVLQSPAAVGRYRGHEVSEFLNLQIKTILPKSILIIDIREANPLQYNFCQFAFGPLLKMIQKNKSENIPTIFQMQEHHRPFFFRGVIKYIDKSISRSASEQAFIQSGMFTMLMLEGKNTIEYIANLNFIELEILNFVNESSIISEREIIKAKKKIQAANIIDALRTLNKMGFIIHHNNSNDTYNSITQHFV